MNHEKLITRVEGHGEISLKIENKKVLSVDLDILTPPRLFEKLIVGRHYSDVPTIVSRICSICSASHRVVSVMAIENALGIETPEDAKLLREMLLHGELLESHGLHLFLLAFPDCLGYPSFFHMSKERPELVRLGFSIKGIGNAIQEKIGGRAIHQITVVVGGMSYVPHLEEMEQIKNRAKPLIKEITDFLGGYSPLKENRGIEIKNWASIDSEIYCYPGIATDGQVSIKINGSKKVGIKDFFKEFNESSLPLSFTKHTLYKGEGFMVGALPRMINSGNKLKGESARMADTLLKDLPKTIDTNNLSQCIEILYSLERTIEIIDILLSGKIDMAHTDPSFSFASRQAEGTAAIEAPRGLLVHTYTLDDNGYVLDGDIKTPTALNLSDIERSLKILAEILIREKDDIRADLETLVRAYDPCISCSVHIIVV